MATVTTYLPAVGPIAAQTATLVSSAQPKLSASSTTLTVDDGTWLKPPSGFTFTWLRCSANGRLCAVIPGAATQAYTLTADDAGHSIVATVNGVLSTRT